MASQRVDDVTIVDDLAAGVPEVTHHLGAGQRWPLPCTRPLGSVIRWVPRKEGERAKEVEAIIVETDPQAMPAGDAR